MARLQQKFVAGHNERKGTYTFMLCFHFNDPCSAGNLYSYLFSLGSLMAS